MRRCSKVRNPCALAMAAWIAALMDSARAFEWPAASLLRMPSLWAWTVFVSRLNGVRPGCRAALLGSRHAAVRHVQPVQIDLGLDPVGGILAPARALMAGNVPTSSRRTVSSASLASFTRGKGPKHGAALYRARFVVAGQGIADSPAGFGGGTI